MFAKNVYKLRYLFFGLYPAFCMYHRLTLTPRRAISKSLLMNIYLSGSPSQRLSQRPFVGSIFGIKICMLACMIGIFLLFTQLKTRIEIGWDTVIYCNNNRPVGYFLVFNTIKETAHEECINTDLSSEFNDLEVPRSVTYEPCDRR